MRPHRNQTIVSHAVRLRRSTSTVVVSFIAPLLLLASSSNAASSNATSLQDEAGSIPGIEAVEALETLVGEWSMTGLTDNGIDGDATGRMFRARQSVEWIEPGRSLGVVWSVMLEDGSVITSGRGRINWDDIAGAVVNTYRGEESGRPFTGSATLIEMGDGVFDWRGHETSGTSESVNFEVTYAFPTNDACVVDFIPTCVDGDVDLDPARFSWNRVNPFHEAVPSAPDLVGVWLLRSGGSEFMPDGSRMTIRPGRGGRSISMVVVDPTDGGDFIGSEILWLDDRTGELGIRSIASDGWVNEGSPSMDRRDGRSALRVVWGAGKEDVGAIQPDPIVSWLTLDGNRIDVDFKIMEPDGRYIAVESMLPQIWERLAD